MGIRLVILDVEGVLTEPGGSQYPWDLAGFAALRERIAASRAAFVLCTGRQVPYAEAVIQALDAYRPLPAAVAARVAQRGGPHLLAWPSIGENGALFYDPLAKQPWPHPALGPAEARILARLRMDGLRPLAARTGAVLEVGKEWCLSMNPPPVAPGSRARQSTELFRPAVEEAVVNTLAGDRGLVTVKHSHSAIDVTPRGIGKAPAVRLLLEWTGLRPDEALGVGDTVADAEWLQEVGHRAAPSNGREALPGMDYYAEQPVIAGVLQILDRFGV